MSNLGYIALALFAVAMFAAGLFMQVPDAMPQEVVQCCQIS